MAVWGTPVAHEDDAERAVRAALDLVAAVAALGEEVGAADSGLRAGVADRRGRGDGRRAGRGHGRRRPRQHRGAGAVASPSRDRCWSTTRPGARPQRRSRTTTPASTSSRARPSRCTLYRALARRRRRAAGRSARAALEAPFVGRDRELRLSRSCSTHARTRARRTCVVGDGHRRRRQVAARLGVREVRRRAGRRRAAGTAAAASPTARASPTGRSPRWCACAARIAEDDPPATALAKLQRDARRARPRRRRARAWSSPGSRTCSGSASRRRSSATTSSPPGGSSSSGWPTRDPVVLVFEDLQWADAALLDFIDHLLDWSRDAPDLRARARPARSSPSGARPGARARATPRRCPSTRSRARRWRELLDGLVPGLPDELRGRILERAQRHPAVRGRDGAHAARPRPARRRTATATAVAGADRRARGARDAARAGRRAPRRARARRSGGRPGRLRARARRSRGGPRRADRPAPRTSSSRCSARSCARRCSSSQADPRSPERGQYGFLQDLLRRVAYDTLSARDRNARHLAAAAHLEPRARTTTRWPRCVAAHYLDAYRADPERSRRRRDPRAGRRRARAGRPPGRVAGCARGGPAGTSCRRRSWSTIPTSRPSC